MSDKEQIFKRLKRLINTGPVFRPIGGKFLKVKDIDMRSKSWRKHGAAHKRLAYYIYQTAQQYDVTRRARYMEYEMMENDPLISTALDIMADDSTTRNEYDEILNIESDNDDVKEILENLFYDILNIEFNLYSWIRNVCKFGDYFIVLDLDEEYGVIGSKEIPPLEVEREEGYDEKNPNAYKFKINALGNAYFESYEVAHFRMLTDSLFLPYGKSNIEAARRVWRQLAMLEDAIMIYRVSRAAEKRVYKIDVAGIKSEDVPAYIEQQKTALNRVPVIDNSTGRMDLKFNPQSITEDFFIPVRGDRGSDITTLPGGTLVDSIADIEYMQLKLISSLKIPKSYLAHDEDMTGKSHLSQSDIRFSRTIERIQRMIESELTKIAIIHLYINGYEDEELINFNLRLTNPSSIAEQLKLDLLTKQLEVAVQAIDSNLYSTQWTRENILGLSIDDMKVIDRQIYKDKKFMAKIEQLMQPDLGMGGEGEMGDEDSRAEDLPEEENESEEEFEESTDLYDKSFGLMKPKDLTGNKKDTLMNKNNRKRRVPNRKTLHAIPTHKANPMSL